MDGRYVKVIIDREADGAAVGGAMRVCGMGKLGWLDRLRLLLCGGRTADPKPLLDTRAHVSVALTDEQFAELTGAQLPALRYGDGTASMDFIVEPAENQQVTDGRDSTW